ncbi:MAG: hypothetical protein RIR70_680 [Pseudomonadota bacterium]
MSTNAAAPSASPKPRNALAARLAKLGIQSDASLVLHLPLRYEDETRLTPVRDLRAGVSAQVEVEVVEAETQFRPRRQLVVQCVGDDNAPLVLRFLNFYASQQKQFATGARLRVFGEPRIGFFGAEMVHPRVRVVAQGEPLPVAMTPIYPTTAGLAQSALRKLIDRALERVSLKDTLPEAVRVQHHLWGFAESVRELHHPSPATRLDDLLDRTHPAWARIKFDELVAQQLSLRIAYNARRERLAPQLPATGMLTHALLEQLPFKLTGAQQRAVADIARDLVEPYPMQRLLQGDVGSGKTIVAAFAMLQAAENGFQAVLMAPTEILAEQHYRKLAAWLAPLDIKVAWLTGSLKKSEKQKMAAAISSGEAMLAVGTHALIEEAVDFSRLGLAIIDEQHRFGVRQRLALREKARCPHQLMMSATPIPRTLAMSYYADLDVSVLDELPPGRTPVLTKLISETRRDEVVERVRVACAKGRQAYWVCPLIEESEALQLQTALDTFERLKTELTELSIGCVHGRLPPAEKAATMQAFSQGDLQVLVATTVIEVGVDVPNASLMVIEHAERFGLSQLHQLRGRVGRGTAESVCILLFANPLSQTARARLKIIFENTDGFEIAREDMKLRGPGEMLGARQSGAPLLRFASLEDDADWVPHARAVAETMLRDHPPLSEAHLRRWLDDKRDFLKV